MTTQFPDTSQYTRVSLRGAPLALARATVSNVKDDAWDANVADSIQYNIPLFGYCFLNSEKLGVSPEAQAEFAFGVVGERPIMVDHEPNRGQCATLGESLRFIDRFRSFGGTCYLDYLPRWAWANPAGSNGLGSPNLQPLADRGMVLVSSYYTNYSDNGPGWNPYYNGCPVKVVQWQFTNSFPFNGGLLDWNAFKGTVQEYVNLASAKDNKEEEMTALQAEGALPNQFAFDENDNWVLPDSRTVAGTLAAIKVPTPLVGPVTGPGAWGAAWLYIQCASPAKVRYSFMVDGGYTGWTSVGVDLFADANTIPIPYGCTSVLIGRQKVSAADTDVAGEVRWRVQYDRV